jgi:glycosyltransferase involved in cell wall biosynthesis
MTDIKDDHGIKRKALFTTGNVAQSQMLEPIIKELFDWDMLVINVNRWGNRTEIEKVLEQLGLTYTTIRTCSPKEAKRFLKEENPDIVIAANDVDEFSNFLIKAANRSGIPTLLIQEGFISENRNREIETRGVRYRFNYLLRRPFRFLKFMANYEYNWHQKLEIMLFELRYGSMGKVSSYGHGECRKMAIFGDAVKEMMMAEGISSDRMVVTGNPKFDRVFSFRNLNSKKAICEKLGISINGDLIVLVTQDLVETRNWTGEQRKNFVLAIIQAVALLPNAELVIKLHPLEKEEDYRELVEGLTFPPIICKNISLPELLSASSLVINIASTAGLEAMAMGKPVVIVNLFNDNEPNLFKDSGALFALSKDDILPAISNLLNNPQKRNEIMNLIDKFVYKQAYKQDGQATRRIADLIRELVICCVE